MLIISLIVLMGVLSVLANLVALAANAAPAFALCLIPAALLLIAGLAARRAQEQRAAGAAPEQTAAPAAAAPPAQSQAAPAAAPRTAAAPTAASRPAAAPRSVRQKPLTAPVKNPAEYRERAIGYRRRLQSLLKRRRRGPFSDLMAAILPRLEGWEERVGQLADRLANFETDRLIQRDIQEVPANIQRMEALWEAEADPATREQIERTLAGYRQQQAQLEALAKLMRRTRFVLDDTLAAMGTIYSQVQVLDAMDIDGTRAAQIGDEIQQQVDRLNDVLSAYTDVNAASAASEDEASEMAARRTRLEQGRSAN